MSRPVVVVFSILAGLQVLTAGSTLTDVVGPQQAAVVVLLVAAVQAGMAFYVQGQVTPHARVAAWRDPTHGVVVAGPANPPGITEGKHVEITEAGDTEWT